MWGGAKERGQREMRWGEVGFEGMQWDVMR